MSNSIRWYENAELDAPELNSPQPCPRGIHCDYRIKNIAGEKPDELVPGCCRGVHPGEEGTGRRLFPQRQVKDTGPDSEGVYEQPACVRLTGGAGFYERRRLRLSWSQWCERQGIPFSPALPGKPFEPVTRVAIRKRLSEPINEQPALEQPITEQPITEQPITEQPVANTHKPTKNQRKRANKKAAAAAAAAAAVAAATAAVKEVTAEFTIESQLIPTMFIRPPPLFISPFPPPPLEHLRGQTSYNVGFNGLLGRVDDIEGELTPNIQWAYHNDDDADTDENGHYYGEGNISPRLLSSEDANEDMEALG